MAGANQKAAAESSVRPTNPKNRSEGKDEREAYLGGLGDESNETENEQSKVGGNRERGARHEDSGIEEEMEVEKVEECLCQDGEGREDSQKTNVRRPQRRMKRMVKTRRQPKGKDQSEQE